MNQLDNNTKEYIANALWQREFNEKKLTQSQLIQINSGMNSNESLGKRISHYLDWLSSNQQTHNPNYNKRYSVLQKYCESLTPQQAYVIVSKFLGRNATKGYDSMPEAADLVFPRDHQPKPKTQVGWHFFVGSAWDEQGKEYGIELMFFRVALLPPNIAADLGLTDKQNQVVEIQLGISQAGKTHFQADPIIISGTTGLIDWGLEPYNYSVGKNKIQSMKKTSFWPLNIKAWGIDKSNNTELSLDLTLESGKEYLFQGDNGCMPCVDGMGTLYYSIPNIVLKKDSKITIGDKKITLKKGTFWFDHQWGFLSGNSKSSVLQAANNISKPAPAGWDWYMAQFMGNRQITMFAAHSKALSNFYFQTGKSHPPKMVVDVAGKYMDEYKNLHNSWGKLTIDKWVKSEQTPNPKLYPVTHTWHPNHWKFKFDDTMPADIREFTMTQIVPTAQTNFFANGSQYNEGAVVIKNKKGKDIGRGFAEAVQYADTTENMFTLAGITDEKDRKILSNNSDSFFGRTRSLAYMLIHMGKLKKILGSAKGLEFFSKPKTPGSRH